ncbi:DUF4282 domain-containing protein [Brevibacterium gallinarum]|uniref:DUF4282 domain-containing protein n=1 Tax=Brevibacterium gallinarum TaxID=2762220 RepID=A0ABR8WR43_9MICO|nr:DUF4282 domain-containing protein [Brevibacterium gallinarum]MBD8019523.1 DUF4282 domain-containing protein [Brevibacterium gallinarum]
MTQPPSHPQDPQQPQDHQQPQGPQQSQDPRQPTGYQAPHAPAAGQSQPGAANPYAQPYSAQPTGAQPTGGQPTGAQSGPAWGGAPESGSSVSGRSTSGFFKALFDVKFDHFVSITWAGIIYVLHILACAFTWIAIIVIGIFFGIAMGVSLFGESSFNPLPLILAILFGWIPALMQLVYGRMILEFIVASIKTSENTRKIAEDTLSLSQR